MTVLFPHDEFAKLKNLLIVYNCALKTVMTKLEILCEDYKNFQAYNPVEHMKCRLKSPESIAEKLYRKGYDITCQNARERLHDIGGVRVICSFSKDIYSIVNALKNQPDLRVIAERNYIAKPKPSGYRSYHIILEIAVYFSNVVENVPVEVQIRTEAMDFWASLEHKVKYKYNRKHIPKYLNDELILCADKIAELDDRMFMIQQEVALNDKDIVL